MLFDELKSYLNGKIAVDKDLSTTIGIKQQYPYGHKAEPPELLLAIIDNTEFETATTFETETVSTVSLQIIPMVNSMNIGGKIYNAQRSCDLLSEKVCGWFDKSVVKENIPKIINTRRVQWSNSYAYESGTTTYYSILRFNLTVTK